MSVLIKGIEMPSRCESCGFMNPFKDPPTCGLTGTRILGNANARLDNCPFVERPDELAKNVYYEERETHCEFKCSLCGATIGCVECGTMDGARFKYCPNCGAEMEINENDY